MTVYGAFIAAVADVSPLKYFFRRDKSMNLSYECVERNATRIPERLAIIDGSTGESLTYAQLNSQVNSIANGLLSLGIQKNDRVAIYLRNVPEFLIAFMAITRIGAIAVPFNIMLKKIEIEYILNHSESRVIFGMSEETADNVIPILDKLPKLEKIIIVRGESIDKMGPNQIPFKELLEEHGDSVDVVDVSPDDGLSILYTSGTTGKPKGVMATHQSWLSQAILNAGQVVPMSEEDGIVTGAPLFHVYVVLTALPTLWTGACFVTLERFFPGKALELITKYKLTHFMGTPTMWAYMIEEYLKNSAKYDISTLRLGQAAGSSFPAELGRQVEEVFKINLVECYGATESSSTVTHTRYGHFVAGTSGWPARGWAIRIVDDEGREVPFGEIGELWIKGPGVLKHYWNDPVNTAAKIEDGWWKSGDLAFVKGRSNTDCCLYLVDRKDDMLVCGGYNIYPSEVENYLAKHPKILQSVVIGIPDRLKGEIPKAFVVLSPGQTATEEEMIKWSKENMAAYKAPRQFEFTTMDELPKTATGKILKRELKRMEIEKK